MMGGREDRDGHSGDLPSPDRREGTPRQVGFIGRIAAITAITIATLLYVLAPLMPATLLGARLGNLIPFWIIGYITLALLLIYITLIIAWANADDEGFRDSVSFSEHPRQALLKPLLGMTGILLGTLGYYVLLHWVATSIPLAFQIAILSSLGLVTLSFAAFLSTDRGQQWLLEGWAGIISPYIYPGLLVMWVAIMTSIFGSVSFVLQRHEVIHLHMARGVQPTVDTTMSFYLWHFFDTLPLLEVTKRLHWVAPVKYYDRAAGALLILYTIAVIGTTIGLFVQMTKVMGKTTSNKQQISDSS